VGAGVDFLVIDAWAMAAHGHQRGTKDIDLFVRASPDNAPRVMRALAAFGAPLDHMSVEDFASPGVVFQVGVSDRVDVTTTIDGLDFESAGEHRIAMKVAGLAVPVIGLDALIANKRASGRPQDLVEVEALKKMVARRARQGS
jgi:hypothetical protein